MAGFPLRENQSAIAHLLAQQTSLNQVAHTNRHLVTLHTQPMPGYMNSLLVC